MPVTVLGADGTGQDSDIIAGVVFAADHGADVILMSFSNPGFSASLQAAIDWAWSQGVVLVAATGNDGSSTPNYPAGDRGVIGVGNTDVNDNLNSSSNTGADVFLAAPGTGILTTSVGGGYGTVTGTSAAAAEVAGAAALIKASSVGASNGVIVNRLAANADPAGTSSQTGNGRLNLARAISDTSSTSIEPAGAAPNGSGGPFVGPYVAAAPPGTSVTNVTFSGASQAAGATTTWTIGFTPTTALSGPSTVTVTFDGSFVVTASPTVTLGPAFSPCAASASGLNGASVTVVTITLTNNPAQTCGL
jgi:hypothetical protein